MLKLNNKVGYNFNRPTFLFILLVVVSVINSVSLHNTNSYLIISLVILFFSAPFSASFQRFAPVFCAVIHADLDRLQSHVTLKVANSAWIKK